MTETLPQWDLSDLYSRPNAPELAQDLTSLEAAIKSFASQYKGQVTKLTSKESLDPAIRAFEQISEKAGKIMSYAQLYHAQNMEDPERGKFMQDMQDKVSPWFAEIAFFSLELNAIPEIPKDSHYYPWLYDLRIFKPHQLSEELERFIQMKEATGRASWIRLFDESQSRLRFNIDGEELPIARATNLLSNVDSSKRKTAAKEIGRVLGENIQLYTMITNVLAKDKETEDNFRNYPAPWSSRHLANQLEEEVVDALNQAVVSTYPQLSHRYYRWKAKALGLSKLEYWDRNAPLPEDIDRHYSWADARNLVLKAYGDFSSELAAIGQKFFDNPWIDAPANPGKAPGAFAHPTVVSAHPYLLLNYLGKARDVMTLAHELGHGVHQCLAAKQGELLAQTPLTLAETASVFGEMLVFQAMLRQAETAKEKRILLAGKIEDMLNTVVRQIAFYNFERNIHTKRREGELSAKEIGDIWMDVQTKSLGDAFNFDPEYSHYWAYIPHFIHSPFYVYAYAFGDCLVNSLYQTYQSNPQGFQAKYLEMLGKGGKERHKELLAPFGLDASNPEFWTDGLKLIEGMITELEKL